MGGECHFCNGLVLVQEDGHIVLDDHGDHEVYLHRQCAVGRALVEEPTPSTGSVEVRCPECGDVETH